MAEIPLPMQQLEEIVGDVTIELLESWASEGRIPDGEEERYAALALDDTVFVINLFMEKFNDAIINSQLIPKAGSSNGLLAN